MNKKIEGYLSVNNITIISTAVALCFSIDYLLRSIGLIGSKIDMSFGIDNIIVELYGFCFGPVIGILIGFLADTLNWIFGFYGSYNVILSFRKPIVGLVGGICGNLYYLNSMRKKTMLFGFFVGWMVIIGFLILLSFFLVSGSEIIRTFLHDQSSVFFIFLAFLLMFFLFSYFILQRRIERRLIMCILILTLFTALLVNFFIVPFGLWLYYGFNPFYIFLSRLVKLPVELFLHLSILPILIKRLQHFGYGEGKMR